MGIPRVQMIDGDAAMNERPGWAQGAEWEGWDAVREKLVVIQFTDAADLKISLVVSKGGGLMVCGVKPQTAVVCFPSPEAARVAAMAIIEGMNREVQA